MNPILSMAGWILIAAEIFLFMIWIYSIFFSTNGTDPAGKGIALFFVIVLAAYIGVSISLLYIGKLWSNILVLAMGGVPLYFVIKGLVKNYHRKEN